MSVTRGPARWERAAVNAVRNPNTAAARLYRDRVTVASDLSRTLRELDKDSAFVFMEPAYSQDATPTRKYSVCSSYCMAMQAQLDFGGGRDGVSAALVGVPRWGGRRCVEAVDASTLSEKIRCQCCGGKVRKA